MQLELGNMAKSGELKEMWDVAAKTNLQFNMVSYKGTNEDSFHRLVWHVAWRERDVPCLSFTSAMAADLA